MKNTIQLLLLGLFVLARSANAAPLGSEFTYEGRLNGPGGPASGSYELTFALNLAVTGGVAVKTITNLNVIVSNGLFTTSVDFGPGFFNGNAYWLEIGVRSNGVAGAFAVLTPRQPLSPTPNASYATLAGTIQNGSVTSAKLATGAVTTSALVDNAVTAAKIAPAQVVKSLNGLRDDVTLSAGPNTTISPSGNTLTISGSSDWQLGGNSATTPGTQFLGTTDNQALVLKVNGAVALRIDPAANGPNIVGGLAANHPTVIGSGVRGAVVAGGAAPAGPVSGFGGGDFHAIYDSDGTIGGGFGNKVGNGNADVNDAPFGTVAGGVFNSAANYASTVAGGDGNTAGGARAAIGGGAANQALSDNSAVGGGVNNRVATNSAESFIGGGNANTIQQGSRHAAISGGLGNTIQEGAFDSIIGGGNSNTITLGAYASTISGGTNNLVDLFCPYSTIGGGLHNSIYTCLECAAAGNTISGGVNNFTAGSAWYSVIPGGYGNSVAGPFSLAAGQNAHADHQGTFVWADSTTGAFNSTGQNQFLVRASGGAQFFGGLRASGGLQAVGGDQWNVSASEGDFRVGTDTYRFKIGVALSGSGAGDVWMRPQGGSGRVFLKTPGGTTVFTSEAENTGVTVFAGGGAWANASDRNAKENFDSVDSREVLERLVALPLTTWNYKSQEKTIRHIGPMAQDFASAFEVGEDDKHITTTDADGVALAAIKGLNEKVEEKETEIRSLRVRLEKLEELLARQLHGREGR